MDTTDRKWQRGRMIRLATGLAALLVALLVHLPARALATDPQLGHVELLTGGAIQDEPLPLIVAIHGLGDRPEAFAGLVRGLGVKARVIVPRAPDPHGGGFSWFPISSSGAAVDVRIDAMRSAADRIASLLAEVRAAHPTPGRAVVMGFSQGGILALVIATRHPDAVALAVPLAGWLPAELTPQGRAPAGAPPIVALHGQADTVLPLGPTREAIERLRALGWDVQLRSWSGVGHSVPGPMRDAMTALVEDAARAQARKEQAR